MLLQYWFNSATCLWNSLSFSKFCFLYVGFSHFFIFFVAIVNWVFLPPLWFLSGYCYSIRKLLATWILVWQFFGCVSSSWQKSNCLISTSLKCQLLRKRKYSFFFFLSLCIGKISIRMKRKVTDLTMQMLPVVPCGLLPYLFIDFIFGCPKAYGAPRPGHLLSFFFFLEGGGSFLIKGPFRY